MTRFLLVLLACLAMTGFFWSSQAEKTLELMINSAGFIVQTPYKGVAEPLQTCTAAIKGYTLFDTTVSHLCYCNGTAWSNTANTANTATACI